MFAVAYAWSAPTEAKMHEKGKAETRDLNPPIGRTGGILPQEIFIFASSEKAGNTCKTVTHYEIYHLDLFGAALGINLLYETPHHATR